MMPYGTTSLQNPNHLSLKVFIVILKAFEDVLC